MEYAVLRTMFRLIEDPSEPRNARSTSPRDSTEGCNLSALR